MSLLLPPAELVVGTVIVSASSPHRVMTVTGVHPPDEHDRVLVDGRVKGREVRWVIPAGAQVYVATLPRPARPAVTVAPEVTVDPPAPKRRRKTAA